MINVLMLFVHLMTGLKPNLPREPKTGDSAYMTFQVQGMQSVYLPSCESSAMLAAADEISKIF